MTEMGVYSSGVKLRFTHYLKDVPLITKQERKHKRGKRKRVNVKYLLKVLIILKMLSFINLS